VGVGVPVLVSGPLNPFPSPPLVGRLPPGEFTFLPAEPPFSAVSPVSQSLYNLDAQAWTLGLKFDYPIIGKSLVYGRAGILRGTFDASDTFGDLINVDDPSDETGWYWGVGLQYPVLPRLLIGGGFAQYDLTLQRFDSWQLNLELLLF
jgi:opacity protein-like surface antigen